MQQIWTLKKIYNVTYKRVAREGKAFLTWHGKVVGYGEGGRGRHFFYLSAGQEKDSNDA